MARFHLVSDGLKSRRRWNRQSGSMSGDQALAALHARDEHACRTVQITYLRAPAAAVFAQREKPGRELRYWSQMWLTRVSWPMKRQTSALRWGLLRISRADTREPYLRAIADR